MKALSLKQPWADLVVDGRKTIETRTWSTSYRGWFYVHASRNVDWKECERLNVKPSATQAVIGKAFLESVKKYDTKEEWDADQGKHLGGKMKKVPMYGFVLKDAVRIDPVPAKGRLGFWEFRE